MIRLTISGTRFLPGIPRESGDDPHQAPFARLRAGYSPRERG